MSAPVILIGGTWGDGRTWWKPGSSFCDAAGAAGIQFADALDPFQWSGDVDGTILDHFLGRRHRDWIAGGDALRWYAHVKVPPIGTILQPVSVVAHSHAGQVALYSAASGLITDTLITVATPVRSDMHEVMARARPYIRRWIHIYGGWRDYWQLLGARSLRRTMPLADQNIQEPGVGHSELLNPNLWRTRGWFTFLHPEAL